MDKKKESTAPILINEDTLGYKTDLHKINYWVIQKYASKIEREFARLNIGSLTDEFLSGILSGDLSVIRIKIKEDISKSLDSQFLGKEIERNVDVSMVRLMDISADLSSTVLLTGINDLLEYLSVDTHGHIVISEESKAELLEAHRKYLHTEDGIMRYKSHIAAAKAINSFGKSMGGRLGNSDALDTFDMGEDGLVKPIPMDYE
jgi:hypothetical protein